MRPLAVLLTAVALLATALLGFRLWQFSRLWPKPSVEITTLTTERRTTLLELRAEHKFQPNNFPPLGYTGAETVQDEVTATQAVDGVIDAILARPNGPLPAPTVAALIKSGLKSVKLLATEDRDRTQGYMLEIWYLLGFKGATGLFAYGSYYKVPPGYGEPLPPGWKSPNQPRPIASISPKVS